MLRIVTRSLFAALALPLTPVLVLAQDQPFAVEVVAPAQAYPDESPEAQPVAEVPLGQVYVWQPGGTQREKIRFTDEIAYMDRAALRPLPEFELYMIASRDPVALNGAELKNGTLVAPVTFVFDKALLYVGGKEAWIARDLLRGPVQMPKTSSETGAAGSGPRTARGKAKARSAGSSGAGADSGNALLNSAGDVVDAARDLTSSSNAAGEDEGDAASAGSAGSRTSGDGAGQGGDDRGAAPPPRGRGRVVYNGKTVSSPAIRELLQRVADQANSTVRVTSGDRDYVPRGGSRTSLHLSHRAADFAVDGQTLEQTFEMIREHRGAILQGGSFEVIWHQPGTNTSGPHIHVGSFPDGRAAVFKTETRGTYRRVS